MNIGNIVVNWGVGGWTGGKQKKCGIVVVQLLGLGTTYQFAAAFIRNLFHLACNDGGK